MNVVFKLEDVKLNQIFFLDTKKNMLMDGNFTKIIYSDPVLCTNGLYILFPIIPNGHNKIMNKNFIYFQPYDIENISIIKQFSELEENLVEYYKSLYGSSKKCVPILCDQLYNGNFKVYKETNEIGDNRTKTYIIKISGLWEDQSNIGLTYKFMEANE